MKIAILIIGLTLCIQSLLAILINMRYFKSYSYDNGWKIFSFPSMVMQLYRKRKLIFTKYYGHLTVEKALEILQDIPEEDFIKNNFSNPLTKKCCSVGHLVRTTGKDPYNFSENNCIPPDIREFKVNFPSIIDINDSAPEGKIKESVIKYLKNIK